MNLQKSFSEQDHSSRHRHLRRRNNSFQGPYRRDELRDSEKPQGQPQVPISSITKNKLNAFHFDAQPKGKLENETMTISTLSTINSDDKENSVVGTRCGAPSRKTESGLKPSPQHDDQTKFRKDIPRTPAGRLAMPDLIGMVDAQRVEMETSPGERVLWDLTKSVIHASTTPVTTGRVKKRARSSSPTSSPAQMLAYFTGKRGMLDLKSLSQTLEAPQIDPGYELWDRYALKTDRTTPQGPQNPALAHIMGTPSPKSSRAGLLAKGEGGLRKSIGRSNSCGTEWPTKRRRVADYGGMSGNGIFSETLNTWPSKLSLVNSLLEKVQEGYSGASYTGALAEPSSSSPIQNREEFREELSSPLGQKAPEVVNTNVEENPPPAFYPDINEPMTQQSNSLQQKPSLSDYGDFDDEVFDEDVMETAEIKPGFSPNDLLETSQPILSNVSEKRSSGNYDYYDITKHGLTPPLGNDEDEFEDMGEDLCAADLEDLVARYDIETLETTASSEPPAVEARVNGQGNEAVMQRDPIVESDDEYDNDFDDLDYEEAEASFAKHLQQPASSLPSAAQKPRAIQRYFVTNVADSQFETSEGKLRPQKILFVQIERARVIRTVNLRDDWIHTPVTVKSYVHVIGDFVGNQCTIDDTHNMLILHPDQLISSTVVADSFGCMRRAVLQDRVKATSESNAPLVYGTILHEIFQAAMAANRWDSDWLSDLITTVATRHLEDLYTIKVEIPQAIEYLKNKMGALQDWAELFVSSQPKVDALVKAGNGTSSTMCVSKLLDVEEHVWSPMYGLKGNIDATVQVTMGEVSGNRTLTVPFEVKTGKNPTAAHRAQTALYNLLLSDRYDIEVAYGILYYMETGETIRIPTIRHELRHMIMQRNELACFVRERSAQLPPMLRNESLCNRCYAQVPCFTYHRLADDGNGETSGMKSKFDEAVRHLTPKHKEFFLKWDDLLTKEEKESLKFRRELWTMLSSEREKLGRCFSSVIIKPGSAIEVQDNPKINRFTYTLIKPKPPANFSFIESQITVGEPIVISDEKGHFALANGYVANVRKGHITVSVDRRLHNARTRRPGFDEINNQVFASIMEVASEGSTPEQSVGKIIEAPVQYRLDKDEFSNGMATVRNNLIEIMRKGPFGSSKIRNLVVDLVPPQFKPHSTAYTLTDRANINIDQRRAIQKVMSARDYALVLGMPGTGKTTTIAHIIRALVSQGKSILLASYTHTAVDNILLKLRNDKFPILRLGSIAKVNLEVQEFAILAARPKHNVEELRNSWHDSPIVATTCLGINHPIFNERTFDYCIVDEASQITLPVCLGPIRMARTFILVGDHNQLPPLVQNEEARTGGLDISLFKLLSDKHPSSVVNLEHQYRMCEDIMTLSNSLIYNGRLKCGTPEVAGRCIDIPNMTALINHHYTPLTISRSQGSICPGPVRGRCWLRDLLDPLTKVSFINTDNLFLASREEAKGNRIVNTTEADICIQLVESLLSVGISAASIGVMTHYRSQLALLKHGLRGQRDVEMHTADRFQGRDKEVVILSLVRSNEAKNIGELLKDWRRINVAFTRARTKLLVVGSRETLKGNDGNGSEEMVSKFVGFMEEKGWIYDLPKGAVESHMFDDTATQVTSSDKGMALVSNTQLKPIITSERKRLSSVSPQKENVRPSPKGPRMPKTARAGERALLSGKPVLRDIINNLRGF